MIYDLMIENGGNSCRAQTQRERKQFRRMLIILTLAAVSAALPVIGVWA